jgi:hypothetical protein
MDVHEAESSGATHILGAPKSASMKPTLPVSCDPPGPANPPVPLVWIVSILAIAYRQRAFTNKKNNTERRFSVPLGTWAVRSFTRH